MTLEWNSNLQLGIKNIDDDHKVLVNLMNQLEAQTKNELGFANVQKTFLSLIQKTEEHFSDEEKHMESQEYPELTRHKFIHSKLLSDLKAHYEDFIDTQRVSEKTFQFLTLWLRAHITIIDRKYVEHGETRLQKIA